MAARCGEQWTAAGEKVVDFALARAIARLAKVRMMCRSADASTDSTERPRLRWSLRLAYESNVSLGQSMIQHTDAVVAGKVAGGAETIAK